MQANAILSVICVTFVLALISLCLQIYVSRQLKKAGQKVNWPIGKRSWITPFVAGWQNAKNLEMTEIMIIWSMILAFTWIGVLQAPWFWLPLARRCSLMG